MNTQNNTPASRDEEVAAVLQSILADACDSESETNVSTELYRRGVEALAASRTEQAAPSVASGVEVNQREAFLDHWVKDVPVEYRAAARERADKDLLLDLGRGPLRIAADAWQAGYALAAPGAAIAAGEQEITKADVLFRAKQIGLVGWVSDCGEWFEFTDTQQPSKLLIQFAKHYAALASRQEAPAASAEEWMPVTPEQHSKAFAAGDLMALAEEAGGARMAENVVQVTRSDIERIIYFAKDREDTAARSPATVAQPVAWWIPKAEQFCMNSPEGRPFAKQWEPLYAAQPYPSQGCGGDGGEVMYALKWCAAALQALVDSRGESGSISMIVSGEKKSLEDVLDLADAALSTVKGDGGSKE